MATIRFLVRWKNEDFVSLDKSELFQPRQPDGNLPTINFLHPAAESRLVDAGVKLDLPFRGRVPDVGAFER